MSCGTFEAKRRPNIRFRTSKATVLEGAIICLLIAAMILSTQSISQPTRNTQTTPSILGSPSQTDTPVKEYSLPPSSGPIAITSDSNRNFWFTEYSSGKIGEFIPQNNTPRTFTVPYVAGNRPTPTSLSIDSQGRIWFSDENRSSIWVFNPSNQTFIERPTKTPKSTPLFVLVDGLGNVWFTENAGNNLGVLSSVGYSMTEYPIPTPNSGPAGLVLEPNTSNLWLTEDSMNGKIAKFSMVTHSFIEYPPSVSLRSPVGIVLDRSGNVWVTEHYGSAIVEFIPSNQTYRKFPTSLPPMSTGYNYAAPATIVIDNQGRLWFEEHLSNRVGRVDPSTGMMEEFLIPTQGAYSFQSTLDSAGNFWFTEYYSDKIGMVPYNATSYLTVQPKPMQLRELTGGQSAQDNVVVSNRLAIPIHLNLSIVSSFTPLGGTSAQEVTLNVTSLDLGPQQNATISTSISPDRTLPSGWYSIGIGADYTNASARGILFLQVQSNPALLDLLSSNLPEFVFGTAIVLGGLYIIIRLRANSSRNRETARVTRPTHLFDVAIGSLLSILLISRYQPIVVEGKCIGLPPPPGGGLDVFSILLLSVGVAIVAVILFFGVRDILRWRKEQAASRKQETAN